MTPPASFPKNPQEHFAAHWCIVPGARSPKPVTPPRSTNRAMDRFVLSFLMLSPSDY